MLFRQPSLFYLHYTDNKIAYCIYIDLCYNMIKITAPLMLQIEYLGISKESTY